MIPDPMGTEGFYLDKNGVPQDEDFHGDCEPGDPEGFNREMWIHGLAKGTSIATLERIYGPRPEGV